ncbi:MAG TPA: RNase adapter RapZ [Xanthomonadales bacterium]|nr:RNase adapter RapZ [Xanthomonadales bacterium]
MSAPPLQLTVVSGLSGSGKTVALHTLEDLDYDCVDNLPAALLPPFVRLAASVPRVRQGLAVAIDARNLGSEPARLPHWLSAAAAEGAEPSVIFFDTRDEVLIKRFSETRRKHPLSHDGSALAEAIACERNLLAPLRAISDRIIDTSDLNVHQLRRLVVTELGLVRQAGLSILFESFAYKHGIPGDADFVFDTRCLPNPHWRAELRPLSGRDEPVRTHLDGIPEVRDFAREIAALLDTWLPRFEGGTRSYVTVAFGCTGGRHRSVYMAEKMAEHVRSRGHEQAVCFHRELE